MKDSDNIYNNDHEGLDPELNRPGNKNPFGTGSDYFDRFADKIRSRVDEYEEIKNEAPVLSNIPKYNPFDVPAGYFDELPSLVQQKCNYIKTTPPIPSWLLMLFRPRVAIPVICLMIIAFTGIHYLNNNNENGKNMYAEETSLDEQLMNIDESTLVEALASASTDEAESDPEKETIKEYLMDNNIDESNLNNEL
jgi:hypothetical protein